MQPNSRGRAIVALVVGLLLVGWGIYRVVDAGGLLQWVIIVAGVVVAATGAWDLLRSRGADPRPPGRGAR